MDLSAQVTKADDGRTLMFAEWGDPRGQPIFNLHGTPSRRLNRHPDQELVRSTGVRLITYDRAGYGGSDRHQGRAVADCVADVAAIADTLGIHRFAVSGTSGGGPHALAVAALLGDRVTRAASVVGVAPYEVLADEWFVGMDPENVKEFGWALEGRDRLTEELERKDLKRQQRALGDPAEIMAEFELPASDRAVLAREDLLQVRRETTLESTRQGVGGWVDDDIAFIKPWGFDPASIRVPTLVWYGTADVMVPRGHGEWLARAIPGATVRLNELGHMGDPDADLVERFAWLRGTAGAAES
jgi:pimeloyl-ACP methyl ester carboxylesterase